MGRHGRVPEIQRDALRRKTNKQNTSLKEERNKKKSEERPANHRPVCTNSDVQDTATNTLRPTRNHRSHQAGWKFHVNHLLGTFFFYQSPVVRVPGTSPAPGRAGLLVSRAAVTKCQKLGDLQQQKRILSTGLEARSPKSRCRHSCAPSEAPGEDPSCLFQLLAAPRVSGASFQSLPPGPRPPACFQGCTRAQRQRALHTQRPAPLMLLPRPQRSPPSPPTDTRAPRLPRAQLRASAVRARRHLCVRQTGRKLLDTSFAVGTSGQWTLGRQLCCHVG